MNRNPRVGFLALIITGITYALFVLYLYLFKKSDVTVLLNLGVLLVLPVLVISAAIVYLRQFRNTSLASKLMSKILIVVFATLSVGLGVYILVLGYRNSVFELGSGAIFGYFLICTTCFAYPLILVKRSFFQSYLARFDRKLIFLTFR